MSKPTAEFYKVINPLYVNGNNVPVFCKIEYTIKCEDGKLSISGVEGPRANGEAYGGCGQIDMHLNNGQWKANGYRVADPWTEEMVDKFLAIWDRWHLNDMRAGCEHQRASWDTQEKIEVVEYALTTAAYTQRNNLFESVAIAVAKGEIPTLTETDKALILCEKWYSQYSPPDADSPLSGCFEPKKREIKAAGWVTQREHPRGLLSKPCEVCGYKYGSAWLKEEVPQDVLDWLKALPDSTTKPAWI